MVIAKIIDIALSIYSGSYYVSSLENFFTGQFTNKYRRNNPSEWLVYLQKLLDGLSALPKIILPSQTLYMHIPYITCHIVMLYV